MMISSNEIKSEFDEKENDDKNQKVPPLPSIIDHGLLLFIDTNRPSLTCSIPSADGIMRMRDRIFRYHIINQIELEGNLREEKGGIKLSFMEEKQLFDQAKEELSHHNKIISQLKEALQRSKDELKEKEELARSWRKDPSIIPKDDDNRTLLSDIGMLVIERNRIADEIKKRENQQQLIVNTERSHYTLLIPPNQFLKWKNRCFYWLPNQTDYLPLSSNHVEQLSIPTHYSIAVIKNSNEEKYSFDPSFNNSVYHFSWNPLSIVDYQEGDAEFNKNFTRITANKPLIILALQPIPLSIPSNNNSDGYYYWKFIFHSNKSGFMLRTFRSNPIRPIDVPGFFVRSCYSSGDVHYIRYHPSSSKMQAKFDKPYIAMDDRYLQDRPVYLINKNDEIKKAQEYGQSIYFTAFMGTGDSMEIAVSNKEEGGWW